jgi:hypothetical protein
VLSLLYAAMTTLIDLTLPVLELDGADAPQEASNREASVAVATMAPQRSCFFMDFLNLGL